jgi:hypothetical protein
MTLEGRNLELGLLSAFRNLIGASHIPIPRWMRVMDGFKAFKGEGYHPLA